LDAFPFSVVLLSDHDRSRFDCGSPALNTYLQKQAGQDMKRRVAACFVTVESETGEVAGYYTLSSCHVDLGALDADWQRRLPRYPAVPAVRLGRLAIDLRFQSRKLGTALLANAVARAIRSEIAAHLMVVDAKDDGAEGFYRHHGFRGDPEESLRLYAPLEMLGRAIGLG
jgi:ribosomal protein S18 acetylase RimI-like enzyme